VADFDQALKLQPELLYGYVAKANALSASGDLEQATLPLVHVLGEAPDYCPGHLSMGYLWQAKGKPERARESFEEALKCAGDPGQRQEAERALESLIGSKE
jgi:Tfp pilus assembly protein PilF